MPRPADVGVGTSAVIIRERVADSGAPGLEVLLGLRRGAHGAGLWGLPGGWVDRGDTSLQEALAREIREETGLEVPASDLRLFDATVEPHPAFSTVTVFYATGCPAGVSGAELRSLEPDKCAVWRWFDVEEPPADLFGSTGAVLRKLVERRQFSSRFSRDAHAAACACGGYADRVGCTLDEVRLYDCERGRLFPSMPCCAVAFVCRTCGARIVGKAEAPELE